MKEIYHFGYSFTRRLTLEATYNRNICISHRRVVTLHQRNIRCEPWLIQRTSNSNSPIRLGLQENLPQFSLLVLVNAFVGGMVGLERTVVPLIGSEEFKIALPRSWLRSS